MPDYTGGYTSAVNDATFRDERQANTKRLLQALQASQWELGEAKKERQRDEDTTVSAAKSLDTFLKDFVPDPPKDDGPKPPPVGPPGGMGMMPPPGAGAPPPPQPMAPGQPSVPMMQPGAPQGAPPPQMGPPQGAMPPPAAAGPPGGAMPPAAPPPPPMPWKPSAAAGPALGGKPPGMGGPQGIAAPPQQDEIMDKVAGVLQKKTLDPLDMFKQFTKQGADPEQALRQVLKLKPLIEEHNQARFKELESQVKASALAERVYKDELTRLRDQMRDESQRAEREAKAPGRAAQANVAQARADKLRGFGKGAPGSATSLHGGSSPDTIDFYATMVLGGDNSWRTGLPRQKNGAQLILDVDNRVPAMAKELGITPQDIGTKKAERAGLSYALKQQEARLAQAEPFVENFNMQADLVEKYAKAGVAGSVPIINRWIQAGRKSIAGDPDVTALDTAIRGAGREHQRIVTGLTSNAQLHASAADMADELLNKDMNAEQIMSSLKVMREEGKNLLTASKGEIGGLKTKLTGLVPSKGDAKADAPDDTAALRKKYGL